MDMCNQSSVIVSIPEPSSVALSGLLRWGGMLWRVKTSHFLYRTFPSSCLLVQQHHPNRTSGQTAELTLSRPTRSYLCVITLESLYSCHQVPSHEKTHGKKLTEPEDITDLSHANRKCLSTIKLKAIEVSLIHFTIRSDGSRA